MTNWVTVKKKKDLESPLHLSFSKSNKKATSYEALEHLKERHFTSFQLRNTKELAFRFVADNSSWSATKGDRGGTNTHSEHTAAHGSNQGKQQPLTDTASPTPVPA